MHIKPASEIAAILDGHEDLAVSIGDEWVSARSFANGSFEEAANYWKKLKGINVLVRDFSDHCKSPTCPHLGTHCDSGTCDDIPCRPDRWDTDFCNTHWRLLDTCKKVQNG